jgi:tRNA (cytidine32/guanosine34-2'-O)-methyltransferase
LDDKTIKITDFGFAVNSNLNRVTMYNGTPLYMAPEVLLKKPYDGRIADIYQIGIMLYILVIGQFPF